LDMIADNIAEIRKNTELARRRSPLVWEEITLLAVTKTVDCPRIAEAMAGGLNILGENRVQELLSKYDSLPAAKWHLIGHLQTNKVKYIIDKVAMIESLDSLSLAEEIDRRAAAAGLVMPVLVQVNIGEDEQKFGLPPERAVSFIREAALLKNIKIEGLMTIGPFYAEAERMRPIFAALRELFLLIGKLNILNVCMKYLSMGMSHDYHIAVEEGANVIRVGSALFGSRTK